MPKKPLDNSDSNYQCDRTEPRRERIKHLLIGSRKTVKATIDGLHLKGYSEVREWSKPQSAGVLGEPGEVVSVLIRHIISDT